MAIPRVRSIFALVAVLLVPGACADEDTTPPVDDAGDATTVDTSESDSSSDVERDAPPDSDADASDALSDAHADDVEPGDDSGTACSMGEYPRNNGCPCETNLQRCCWGGAHMSCNVLPDESVSWWGEVYDANWNCDELPDCEDFEGVPPP